MIDVVAGVPAAIRFLVQNSCNERWYCVVQRYCIGPKSVRRTGVHCRIDG
jgi:hypothetical protein